MTDLKKLRELALAATPGPWRRTYTGDGYYTAFDFYVKSGDVILFQTDDGEPADGANSEFVAASNPQAIIEILDMVDRYREALEHYESAHYTISGFPCDHDGVARKALEGGK